MVSSDGAGTTSAEWETWRVRQDTIMVFRMVFLWMVAAAVARGAGERAPDFIMEHPEDPSTFMKQGLEPRGGSEELTSIWAFPEFQYLKNQLGWHWWQFDQGPLGHPRRKPTRDSCLYSVSAGASECSGALGGFGGGAGARWKRFSFNFVGGMGAPAEADHQV